MWFGLFTLNNKKYQIRSQSKSWTDAVYLKEAYKKIAKIKNKKRVKIYQTNTNKNVGFYVIWDKIYFKAKIING